MTRAHVLTRGRAVPFAIAALAFAVFLSVALVVLADALPAFDAWLLLASRDPTDLSQPLGPAWLHETARDFTALGSNGVLIALTLAGAGLLALTRRRESAVFLLASFWGGLVLESAAKLLFDRPRPELVPHAAQVFTTSFPSGHATVSAAAALAVAVLLVDAGHGRAFNAFAAAVAACFVAVIGVSRVYLGVHWPTDVMAGWALGTGWAALCWGALARSPAAFPCPGADGPAREGTALLMLDNR